MCNNAKCVTQAQCQSLYISVCKDNIKQIHTHYL